MIKAPNYTDKHIYIKSVTLNGKNWNKAYINHADIVKGGELIFKMSKYPNKKWATESDSKPKSTTN